MEIKTISATFGAKINLGDFNSAHVEITLGAELAEGESAEESTKQLLEQARSQVREVAISLKAKTAPRIQEAFAGVHLQE